uniref:hypothetical protein n=1 Tax=Streptomyces cyaneofuscatus TaxID=66883 RepID=UPI002FF03E6B
SYSYTIVPRPSALGGGWKLTLLERGEEVGGGVFPLPAEDSRFGMQWWNDLTAARRAHWLMMAVSAAPADARTAFLLAEEYDNAREEGETWIQSRNSQR